VAVNVGVNVGQPTKNTCLVTLRPSLCQSCVLRYSTLFRISHGRGVVESGLKIGVLQFQTFMRFSRWHSAESGRSSLTALAAAASVSALRNCAY
jgi:hypothetical protein